MARSNYDKPFYVDVGTSIAAVRCASNRDVVCQRDHAWGDPSAIQYIKELCDRLNKEAELFYSPRATVSLKAREALAAPVRNCDRFATVKDAAIEFSKLRNNPHPCPDFVFSEWLLAIAEEGGANA